jgi:hypothetical protein
MLGIKPAYNPYLTEQHTPSFRTRPSRAGLLISLIDQVSILENKYFMGGSQEKSYYFSIIFSQSSGEKISSLVCDLIPVLYWFDF